MFLIKVRAGPIQKRVRLLLVRRWSVRGRYVRFRWQHRWAWPEAHILIKVGHGRRTSYLRGGAEGYRPLQHGYPHTI